MCLLHGETASHEAKRGAVRSMFVMGDARSAECKRQCLCECECLCVCESVTGGYYGPEIKSTDGRGTSLVSRLKPLFDHFTFSLGILRWPLVSTTTTTFTCRMCYRLPPTHAVQSASLHSLAADVRRTGLSNMSTDASDSAFGSSFTCRPCHLRSVSGDLVDAA